MPSSTTQQAQTTTFQGIVVPGSSYNPKEFFKRTRRQLVLYKTISSWAGFGNTDVVGTFRSGILAALNVKIAGSLVIALNSGTCATTPKWPYGILRNCRFQANGQSNLIAADGWFLRLREATRNEDFSDRGVQNYVGGSSPGTSRTQGTLALDTESWGVGSNVSGLSSGTYSVELSIRVPVAYETKRLTGAVFCQTTSTTLELDLDWANETDLFTLTGAATVTFSPTVSVEAEVYTIPKDGKGGFFLPDLSNFHSYIQTKSNAAITAGNNEFTLAGQGVGRQLTGIFWRLWNSAAPVIPTDGNITQPYWRYGTNETPEEWLDGQTLRVQNERDYGVDISSLMGFLAIDFDREFAFRDVVDEGSATELRFGESVSSSISLSSPYIEYAQDVLLAGAAA